MLPDATCHRAICETGYLLFDDDPMVLRWSTAARPLAEAAVARNVDERRHGGTWFVGVDALPNAADGSVSGVPLGGEWRAAAGWTGTWHRAQVSGIWPGYPRRDADETEAAHRFRRDRDAAHLDGLLPEGRDRRRHLREPHAVIVGLPLTDTAASPLVVWPGSHRIVGDMIRAVLGGREPDQIGDIDLTEPYAEARRRVFADCPRVELPMRPGQAIVLHRMLIHGVAPWRRVPPSAEAVPRLAAYFRPLFTDPALWVTAP